MTDSIPDTHDNGNTEATVYQKLDYLLERRRLDAARALLARALPERPEDPDLLFYAAWVEYLEDAYPAAEELLGRLLKVAPEHAGGRYVLFLTLRETERHAEAEELIIGLLSDYPEDPDYYAAYARLMLETLNVDKARQLAERSLQLDPEGENALLVVALASLIAGRRSEADARLEELVDRHPESFRTMAQMVVALSDQGRNEEALPLAQQMLRLEPHNEHVVDLVIELQTSTHWSMKPLWPMQRFGWAGSAVLWLVVIGFLRVFEPSEESPWMWVVLAIAVTWILYVIYSWAWPPLLKRMLR